MKTKYRIVECKEYRTNGYEDTYHLCNTRYKIQYKNLFTIIFNFGWEDLSDGYFVDNDFLSYEEAKKFLDDWIRIDNIKEKTDTKVVYEE